MIKTAEVDSIALSLAVVLVSMASLVVIITAFVCATGRIGLHCDKTAGKTDDCHLVWRGNG